MTAPHTAPVTAPVTPTVTASVTAPMHSRRSNVPQTARPASAWGQGAVAWSARPLLRWAFWLWLLAAATAVVGLLLEPRNTSLFYGQRMLRLWVPGQDSWRPMVTAIELLRADPGQALYSHLFFDLGEKFQYPVTSLLPLDLLQRFWGAPWPRVIQALNLISWAGVWILGLTCWRLLLGSLSRVASGPGPDAARHDAWWLLPPVLALTFLFYPLSRSFMLGQIQTWLTVALALALLAWRGERTVLAGVLLASCCAVKPHLGVVFLWAALRSQWTMVAAGALVLVPLALAAGLVHGFDHFPDYVPVLQFLSRHGEAFFANQSINGLLNRLFETAPSLDWQPNAFPTFHPVVFGATMLSTFALLGAALAWRRRLTPDAHDLALMLLTVTVAAPIAWEHHYAVLLPIFALAAPGWLWAAPPRRRRAAAAGLMLLFMVVAQRFDITHRLAHTWMNPLLSYLFFGALVVLVLLFRRDPQRAGPQ